jgi:hypothetical protein
VDGRRGTRGLLETAAARLAPRVRFIYGRRIVLPVRYAGLAGQARVRRADGRTEMLPVTADRTVAVDVRIPARGHAWLTLEADALR